MKKWAGIGILAALIVSVLLIGKYQDQKYPIQPDHSNLLEEVTWWVNRGYDQPVLDDIVIHDYVELGDQRYVLVDVEGQLGEVWLKKGMNGQYRMNGHGHGTGNFRFEKVEVDGIQYFLWSGKNEYFGIAESSFEVDDKTYRVEIPEGDRFLTLVEVDPPSNPDAPVRYIDVNTVRFYDGDGRDITDQVPWNGMRPWDGAPSVSEP